jgi:hypothetical protein
MVYITIVPGRERPVRPRPRDTVRLQAAVPLKSAQRLLCFSAKLSVQPAGGITGAFQGKLQKLHLRAESAERERFQTKILLFIITLHKQYMHPPEQQNFSAVKTFASCYFPASVHTDLVLFCT